MQNKSLATRRLLTIGLIVALTLGILVLVVLSLSKKDGDSPINPNKDAVIDEHEGTGDGKTSAVLYNSGNLYKTLGNNDDILENVGKDLLLFGRTTQAELKDTNALIGFTFSREVKQKDGVSTFTGKFYGSDHKIEIVLTPHGHGVYTLSVTDLQNGTNIDDKLSLNGKRNTYIQTLPIEKGYYSIRYQVPLDSIVVTFYDGYTNQHIDEAVASITAGLGRADDPRVSYSINRIGVVTLDQVRQNLVTPISPP